MPDCPGQCSAVLGRTHASRRTGFGEGHASNRAKHGLSLALAERFDWLTGRVQAARTVGGESRLKLIVLFEGIVYSAIFTRRSDVYWIISLRYASRKERRTV